MSDRVRLLGVQCLVLLTPSSKGLQNFMHPRSDAVVIMLVIDQTGDKILLGRGVSYRIKSVRQRM